MSNFEKKDVIFHEDCLRDYFVFIGSKESRMKAKMHEGEAAWQIMKHLGYLHSLVGCDGILKTIVSDMDVAKLLTDGLSWLKGMRPRKELFQQDILDAEDCELAECDLRHLADLSAVLSTAEKLDEMTACSFDFPEISDLLAEAYMKRNQWDMLYFGRPDIATVSSRSLVAAPEHRFIPWFNKVRKLDEYYETCKL